MTTTSGDRESGLYRPLRIWTRFRFNPDAYTCNLVKIALVHNEPYRLESSRDMDGGKEYQSLEFTLDWDKSVVYLIIRSGESNVDRKIDRFTKLVATVNDVRSINEDSADVFSVFRVLEQRIDDHSAIIADY